MLSSASARGSRLPRLPPLRKPIAIVPEPTGFRVAPRDCRQAGRGNSREWESWGHLLIEAPKTKGWLDKRASPDLAEVCPPGLLQRIVLGTVQIIPRSVYNDNSLLGTFSQYLSTLSMQVCTVVLSSFYRVPSSDVRTSCDNIGSLIFLSRVSRPKTTQSSSLCLVLSRRDAEETQYRNEVQTVRWIYFSSWRGPARGSTLPRPQIATPVCSSATRKL